MGRLAVPFIKPILYAGQPFIKGDYYALIVVTSVLLASVGTISLMRAVKKSTAPSMNKAEEFKHKVGETSL